MKTKIFTKFLSVMIAAVLLAATLIVPVGAVDNADNSPRFSDLVFISKYYSPYDYEPVTLNDTYAWTEKKHEFESYYDSLFQYFYPFWLWGDPDIGYRFELLPGRVGLCFDEASAQDFNAALKSADQFCGEFNNKINENTTDEEFRIHYDELKKGMKTLEIDNSQFSVLIELCDKEDNANYFYRYSDEVWEPFVTALNNAKEAYNEHTQNGSVEAYSAPCDGNTELYWALYFAYNRLCMQLNTPGDLNGDGEADVVDVTILQRTTLNIGPRLNAAQRCMGSLSGVDDWEPTVTDVTILQRYTLDIYDQINAQQVPEQYAECMNYQVNPLVDYAYIAAYRGW